MDLETLQEIKWRLEGASRLHQKGNHSSASWPVDEVNGMLKIVEEKLLDSENESCYSLWKKQEGYKLIKGRWQWVRPNDG